MLTAIAKRRQRRDARRVRRTLAVLLLHDTLGLPGPSGWQVGGVTGAGARAYVVLAGLERDGLVVSGWEPGPAGKPHGSSRRRLYRLTDEGRVQARAATVAWLLGAE